MDKLVQKTAAIAEESASSSEELKTQAEQMTEAVEEMMSITIGSDRKIISAAENQSEIINEEGSKKLLPFG